MQPGPYYVAAPRGLRPGRASRTAAVALALLGVGCSHLRGAHWPWRQAPQPAPAPVHELDIAGSDADARAQYWKRNTLVVDISSAAGSGRITLKPVAGSTWPVRMALRVRPGGIGMLEVHGAQRLTLPIATTAGPAIDLELPPGLYTAHTPQLEVSWGASGTPAP